MNLVRVALDVPVANLFDYHIDTDASDVLGARVLVPFGRGLRAGVIVEAGGDPQVPVARIKRIASLLQHEPRLPPDVLQIMRFASRYYRFPLGQVVMAALPQALRRVRGERPQEQVRLTDVMQGTNAGVLSSRAMAQRRVLSYLREHGPRSPADVRALWPGAGKALHQLVERGLAVVESASTHGHVSPTPQSPGPGPELNSEQRDVLEAIAAHPSGFSPWLLLGVTGSGKTEVYLHLIARTLALGSQALLLVPEISLTPQLEGSVAARFPGATVTSLHSGIAQGERLRRWRLAESGAAHVVLGTRLAAFTPMPKLGLIIVDEEHDASFKQQDGLRYSARDLAVVRAKQREVPVVLGSATPSLESYGNALAGRYRLVMMAERARGAAPTIRCVDTRGQRLNEGLAPALLDGVRTRLEAGEQSLVFVNRRGYSPAIICFGCGWSAGCSRCSARLVYHLKAAVLRCHYCGHQEALPSACLACGNVDVTPAGQGTQRIEAALAQRFPEARLLRIDRDTTRTRNAFENMRSRVQANDVDVLVGTQMLAKGHDFPRLTLVGVVNADHALYSGDFRASEKLFALLTQVAGRAGRGDRPGEVLIQTAFPDHPLYQAVRDQNYADFAQRTLEERREAEFPPYAHQVLLRAEATERAAVDRFLNAAAHCARRIAHAVTVYDPVPAPMPRMAGRERGHLLVQAQAREALQHFLDLWEPMLSAGQPRQVRWVLDVDPLDL